MAKKEKAKVGDPLTKREQEVHELLAGLLSDEEIAERLFIDLRTVQFHTANIRAKLGVSNRVAAIRRFGTATAAA